MTFRIAATLAGLALATQASAGPCIKYRVLAEKNELASEEEVARWAADVLKGEGVLDEDSPCFVHVRITALPIRTGGRQDGWIAHVSVSTRKYLKEGKLVANEKGMLFVESQRETLAANVRRFVEQYASKVPSLPAGAKPEDPNPGTRSRAAPPTAP